MTPKGEATGVDVDIADHFESRALQRVLLAIRVCPVRTLGLTERAGAVLPGLLLLAQVLVEGTR
ncbi:hypothetical protein [Methanopyrus kandleri]